VATSARPEISWEAIAGGFIRPAWQKNQQGQTSDKDHPKPAIH